MVRDGRELEELVAELERLLLPNGFTLRPPRVIERDEKGEQISELDIVIDGPEVDGKRVLWIIECRDRRSPQGIEWIEQLVGRRSRLQADQIVAVSTSGFSSGAKAYAAEANVVLRTVQHIAQISSDVLVQRIAQGLRKVEPTGEVELGGMDERPDLPVGAQKASRARLRRVGEERFQRLDEFAQNHYAPEQAGIQLGSSACDDVLEASDVEILFDGDAAPTHAEKVRVRVHVEEEMVAGVVVSLKRYDESGLPRGHQGIYVFDSSRGRSYAKVDVVPADDGAYLVNVSGQERIGDYVFTRASIIR